MPFLGTRHSAFKLRRDSDTAELESAESVRLDQPADVRYPSPRGESWASCRSDWFAPSVLAAPGDSTECSRASASPSSRDTASHTCCAESGTTNTCHVTGTDGDSSPCFGFGFGDFGSGQERARRCC